MLSEYLMKIIIKATNLQDRDGIPLNAIKQKILEGH